MVSPTPESVQLSKSQVLLRNAVDRYAKLVCKADSGRLQDDELDQLLLTGLRMRTEARVLGITNKQLEVMLDNMVQHLGRRPRS